MAVHYSSPTKTMVASLCKRIFLSWRKKSVNNCLSLCSFLEKCTTGFRTRKRCRAQSGCSGSVRKAAKYMWATICPTVVCIFFIIVFFLPFKNKCFYFTDFVYRWFFLERNPREKWGFTVFLFLKFSWNWTFFKFLTWLGKYNRLMLIRRFSMFFQTFFKQNSSKIYPSINNISYLIPKETIKQMG